jgi:hypothetical protein
MNAAFHKSESRTVRTLNTPSMGMPFMPAGIEMKVVTPGMKRPRRMAFPPCR